MLYDDSEINATLAKFENEHRGAMDFLSRAVSDDVCPLKKLIARLVVSKRPNYGSLFAAMHSYPYESDAGGAAMMVSLMWRDIDYGNISFVKLANSDFKVYNLHHTDLWFNLEGVKIYAKTYEGISQFLQDFEAEENKKLESSFKLCCWSNGVESAKKIFCTVETEMLDRWVQEYVKEEEY